MRRLSPLRSFGTLLALVAAAGCELLGSRGIGSRPPGREALERRAMQTFAGMPLHFEPQPTAGNGPAEFVARGPGYAMRLGGPEALIALHPSRPLSTPTSYSGPPSPQHPTPNTQHPTPNTPLIRMKLAGANPRPKAVPLAQLPTTLNYFFGKDPKQWRTGVHPYGKVKYAGVYAGVDLVYYGNQRQLEYDLVVHPNADPDQIALDFTGADDVRLDPTTGELILQTELGELRQHRPIAYQTIADKRIPVLARFVLGDRFGTTKDTKNTKGEVGAQAMSRVPTPTPTSYSYSRSASPTHPSTHTPTHVTFALGSYDKTKPLVIDPPIAYASYLGGAKDDYALGIAADAAGAAYVCGQTASLNFPLAGAVQGQLGGGDTDAFVSKVSPDGSSLVFSTYFGGSGNESAYGIALGPDGTPYVTGSTESTNLPATAGYAQPVAPGNADGFALHLSADGGTILYDTYVGGGGYDQAYAIAVDAAGRACVTGSTSSIDLPVIAALQPQSGGNRDAFVARLSTAGDAFGFFTYLGGAGDEVAFGVAADGTGGVCVGGDTDSPGTFNFNGFQRIKAGPASTFDGFLVRIDSSGSLVYSSYAGGTADDSVTGVAALPDGRVYAVGWTQSRDFPLKNAARGSFGNDPMAFILEVGPQGALVFSSFGPDTQVNGTAGHVAVDATGVAHTLFLSNAFSIWRFGPDGSLLGIGPALVDSAVPLALAVDPAGARYIAGFTSGVNDFPVSHAFQSVSGGMTDAFVAKLAPPPAVPPRDLAAVAVTPKQVDLTWTYTGTDANGLSLERKSGSSPFTRVALLPVTARAFSDESVSPDTAYVYRLIAFNDAGDSVPSNEAPVRTPFAPPPAPTDLRAIGTMGAVDLNWTDNSGNEEVFEIERRQGAGEFALVAAVGPNVTHYSDTGLPPATSFTYRVRATAKGFASDYSNVATGITLAPVPKAPSGLSATAISTTAIDLSWTDNSTDENGFQIERREGTGAFGEIASTGANVAAYRDTGLSSNTAYTYRVRAFNGNGSSPYSAEASATTPPNLPSAPSGLTASPVSPTSIALAWTDTSSNETRFVVERRKGSDAFAPVATLPANTGAYTDTGLSPETRYIYRVRAGNDDGDSRPSEEAAATTPSPLAPPGPTGLTATGVSQTQVDLAWTDASSDELGFKIERRTENSAFVQVGTAGRNATTYADTALAPDTAYSYRVRAFNASGDSGYSNTAAARTLPEPPSAPTGLTARDVTATQATLVWTDTSLNETAFRIERRQGSAPFGPVTTVGANATSFIDTGLAAGTRYTYRVFAVNLGGDSSPSNEIVVTTSEAPPIAPSNLQAWVAASREVGLLWQDGSTTETGFRLERKSGTGGFQLLAQVGANVERYSDKTVRPGTTYVYRVQAVNSGGGSDFATSSPVTTPDANDQRPVAPVNFRAIGFSDRIALAWEYRGTGQTGFLLERGTTPGSYDSLAVLDGAARSYDDRDSLQPNRTYFYQVRALGPGGQSDPARADARLRGTGVVVSPLKVDFGAIRVRTARTRTVTVQNLGTETATVQIVRPTAPFAVTAPGTRSLKVPGGQTRTVTVQFRPAKKGSAAGTLTLRWVEQNKSFSVKLQGKGL